MLNILIFRNFKSPLKMSSILTLSKLLFLVGRSNLPDFRHIHNYYVETENENDSINVTNCLTFRFIFGDIVILEPYNEPLK